MPFIQKLFSFFTTVDKEEINSSTRKVGPFGV